LNFGRWGIFCNGFVRNVGLIFSLVFNLFIISVGYLNGLVIGVLNSLIVGDGLGDFNLVTQSSSVGLNVLSFIRDLFVGNHGLIISIIFL
jgi:hypothetical protein